MTWNGNNWNKICALRLARVIVLILPVLFDYWLVWDWLCLQSADKLSKSFSWNNLGGIWKGSGMIFKWKKCLMRHLRMFPLSGKNSTCEIYRCREKSLCCCLRVGNFCLDILFVGTVKMMVWSGDVTQWWLNASTLSWGPK